jgi:hypothetical protein
VFAVIVLVVLGRLEGKVRKNPPDKDAGQS